MNAERPGLYSQQTMKSVKILKREYGSEYEEG
jgi:hypothetical protein